ncbi:MAG: hypothetical protein FJ207_01620 [Gemmatimonadetes bacterium]|nr:hypothetical protein [Gemmatimonadota bacterium]
MPVEALGEVLGDLVPEPEQLSAPASGAEHRQSWRVLLWTVDPETRIGRDEFLEATGKPKGWLYRHTGEKSTERIPHRRLDGQLVFVVGEVRRWLREREVIEAAGPMNGAPRVRSIGVS